PYPLLPHGAAAAAVLGGRRPHRRAGVRQRRWSFAARSRTGPSCWYSRLPGQEVLNASRCPEMALKLLLAEPSFTVPFGLIPNRPSFQAVSLEMASTAGRLGLALPYEPMTATPMLLAL